MAKLQYRLEVSQVLDNTRMSNFPLRKDSDSVWRLNLRDTTMIYLICGCLILEWIKIKENTSMSEDACMYKGRYASPIREMENSL
jgi:hypothetical protein